MAYDAKWELLYISRVRPVWLTALNRDSLARLAGAAATSVEPCDWLSLMAAIVDLSKPVAYSRSRNNTSVRTSANYM